MVLKFIVFWFCSTVIVKCVEFDKEYVSNNSEIFWPTEKIITSYGYPFEKHQVLTDDGYFLQVHRIPYGKRNTINETRPVVFLQHGLLDSSFTWVSNLPNQSLAFILADEGFDVWLGNCRGNVYSRGHIRYSANSNDYWNFSWDEMAEYDLPAMLKHVLRVTNAKKISYIGHSQGTAIAFAKFSTYSELNDRIASMVAYAPVAYLGNIKSGIRYLSYVAGGIDLFYKIFKHGEFLPTSNFIKLLSKYVCGTQSASAICHNILFLITGPDVSNMNYKRLPVYLGHIPSGTSSKNMVQFAQSYKSNEFKKFDHGYLGNLYYYKRLSPPVYNLDTNGIPLALFWGGNDYLATPEDVNRALHEFNNDVKFRKFIKTYNHMDFVWGLNAPEVLYQDTIKFIRKYMNSDK